MVDCCLVQTLALKASGKITVGNPSVPGTKNRRASVARGSIPKEQR